MPDHMAVQAVATHYRALKEAGEMVAMERALMLRAMRDARATGASYQLLADAMGLSRQRVFDMLKDDQRRRAPLPVEDVAF